MQKDTRIQAVNRKNDNKERGARKHFKIKSNIARRDDSPNEDCQPVNRRKSRYINRYHRQCCPPGRCGAFLTIIGTGRRGDKRLVTGIHDALPNWRSTHADTRAALADSVASVRRAMWRTFSNASVILEGSKVFSAYNRALFPQQIR